MKQESINSDLQTELAPGQPATGRPGSSGAPHILVVEDDPDLLELLRLALGAEGCTVMAVDRPKSALSGLDHSVPNLALLDLTLPGMNGIDLARQLRANGLAQVPMIAMSASPFLLETA